MDYWCSKLYRYMLRTWLGELDSKYIFYFIIILRSSNIFIYTKLIYVDIFKIAEISTSE